MSREQFIADGLAAGFDDEQLEFMWDFLAKMPHTHTAEDIIDLDEYLEGDEEDE